MFASLVMMEASVDTDERESFASLVMMEASVDTDERESASVSTSILELRRLQEESIHVNPLPFPSSSPF